MDIHDPLRDIQQVMDPEITRPIPDLAGLLVGLQEAQFQGFSQFCRAGIRFDDQRVFS